MNGIARYKQARSRVEPEQLVLLLLQEAVVRLTRLESTSGNDARWIKDLHHVRAIVLELFDGLDPSVDEAMVTRLANLYQWCIEELIRAGSEREKDVITPVRKVLETLLEAWQHILREPTPPEAA
ncbi:MAG: flagellar protein FliS [Myxococcota bacterium]